MTFDAIIVGAGASGLTAAAYLASHGHKVLLCEKEALCGGLVNSFERNGFTYDSGIRALEDAGVLFTMLRQLGLEMEFVKNRISMGIEDQVFPADVDGSIDDYAKLLNKLYPDSTKDIDAIIQDLRVITHLMEIQYGIDNPLFLDPKKDMEYYGKKVLPWMFKYALNVRKVQVKDQPVIPYLKQFTSNQSLLDIITQHFFKDTPAYFALSYFKIFKEYYYPKTGTGAFILKLIEFIEKHGGEIHTNTEISSIDLIKKTVTTSKGVSLPYRQLIWCADQNRLYSSINSENLDQPKVLEAVETRKVLLTNKTGNDSIFSLFLAVNLDKRYFKAISAPHFFYTPSRLGQSAAGEIPTLGSKEEIQAWLRRFLPLTTYEISIPVLRNAALAPQGKSGLIFSVLFDYALTKRIEEQGWTAEFREMTSKIIIETLDKTIYPGLAEAVIEFFNATPLTIQKYAGTTHGAITGWSFSNQPLPAENRLVRIANAVNTPLPDVLQAGQWTYSPAGLPVSLITGKLAADKAHKRLGK